MNLTVTGRSQQVTDEMKEYAEKKIDKVSKFFPKIVDVHIILDINKYRFYVEVTLSAGHLRITAKDETEDMSKSIDRVVDKLEKQLIKYKQKLQDHKKRSVSKSEGMHVEAQYEGDVDLE